MVKLMNPERYLSRADVCDHQLVHAVWELTLACNLKCRHCGSRAGQRRPAELSTQECLDVVGQLRDLGTREVTLIGGEAYLRRDWATIIRAITDAGMQCTLQTGAWQLTEKRVGQAKDAGLVAAGVSVDGLADLHDHLRARRGSFDAAIDALGRLRDQGIKTSVNTQITAAVIPQLRELLDRFLAVGVRNWQVQLTVAMGRAADNHQLLMQPYQMLDLMPLLADIYAAGAARGLLLQPGNNIGYFGPYEAILRGSGNSEMHWAGCFAGRNSMGIEADGTIKGCPSLPTSAYAGGNVRETSLADIWSSTPELSFARNSRTEELWGFCRTCYYADVCQGGCTWTSHSLLGKPGNNPYCHYRACELHKQGMRERVVRRLPAPGQSFDHGEFDLLLEPEDGTRAIRPDPGPGLDRQATPPTQLPERADAHLPFLILCHGCHCYVFPGTELCPHCGGDVPNLQRDYEQALIDAQQASTRLSRAMNLMQQP